MNIIIVLTFDHEIMRHAIRSFRSTGLERRFQKGNREPRVEDNKPINQLRLNGNQDVGISSYSSHTIAAGLYRVQRGNIVILWSCIVVSFVAFCGSVIAIACHGRKVGIQALYGGNWWKIDFGKSFSLMIGSQ